MFEEINFTSTREFYEKRETIQEKYNKMSYGEKFVYKSYVYSKDIPRKYRNIIWEYLNEPKDSEDYIKACLEMTNFRGGKL